MVVEEIGWDSDVDEDLRDSVMDDIEGELLDESDEPVDAVLLWQRDDSDVGDGLVDALRDLADDGFIWLLTPRRGQEGFVETADIHDGAQSAGLQATSIAEVSPTWAAIKVVRPGNKPRK
jgi:hypothetical protein